MKIYIQLWISISGEAKVRRKDLEVSYETTDSQIRRVAKKAMGLTGVRGIWEDIGDCLRFLPYGICQEMHVAINTNPFWDRQVKLYKTAFSPMFNEYVSITHAYIDDDGRWLFYACLASEPDHEIIFRKEELENFVL